MVSRTHRPLASLVALTLALGASSCAAPKAPVARELASLDGDDLRARVPLGPLGRYGEAGPGAQARAAEAALGALKLGNLDEARAFAREQLELARVEFVLARLALEPDPAREQAAREALAGAAAIAVEVGDAALDGPLVLEAAQFLDNPARERKAIDRALLTAQTADIGWGYARLWSAYGTRPRQLAALQRLQWRAHDGDSMPEGAPRLSPEQIGALGFEGVDLLWPEADRAATEGRGENLQRWLDAILDADRWDPDAASARLVLDAVERGVLTKDPQLLPDLATNTNDILGAQARWLLRLEGTSGEARWTVQLRRATDMLRTGSFGDAGQLLAELAAEGDAPSSALDDLADTLAAMVALESGTDEGREQFARWRRKHGGEGSNNLAEWTQRFDMENAPEGHVDEARRASYRLFDASGGRASPRVGLGIQASVAIDRKAPRRVRQRALAALASQRHDLGARVGICRERALFGDDCRDLLVELGKLDDASEDYPAGLDALDGAANVRSSWFAPVPWLGSGELPMVRDRLSRYEGTRVAATTDFQTAALFSELAANRPDLARARLAVVGDLLRPETQLIAQMALADLEEGLIDPAALSNLLLEIPPAEIDAEWIIEGRLPGEPAEAAQMFPGRSRLARFARGMAMARMGAWQPATAELLGTLEVVEGEARGIVAGRLALVAQLAGESTLYARALTITEGESPDAFMLSFVRARAAEAAGRPEIANRHYADALAKRPTSRTAFDGVLRTLPLARRELDRVRDALLVFPDRATHWHASALLDAAANPERAGGLALDGHLMTSLWLAREDGDAALALGEPAARVATTAEAGLDRILLQLRGTPMASEAFPIAVKALDWLAAMPADLRVEYRDVELWLTLLIRPDDEFIGLLDSPHLYDGYPEARDPGNSMRLLIDARKRRAIDDMFTWSLARAELWGVEDEVTQVELARLYGPISDPALAEFACVHIIRQDEFDLATERCVPLWNETGGTAFMAPDVAYLALNRPELVRAKGLDTDSLFSAAERIPALAEDSTWLINASLWASLQDDDRAGARLRVEQLARAPFARELDDIEWGQVQFRGPLVRQQVLAEYDPEDRRRLARVAGLAVRSLDFVAAELYSRRLLAWLSPEAGEGPELTAEAPQVLAAQRLEGETSDAELQLMALFSLGMGELAEEDLLAGRIERDALLALFDAYAEDQGLSAYEPALEQFPDCQVAMLMALEGYQEARMRDQAIEMARALVALRPTHPLVLGEALPLLTGPEDLDSARTLLAAARVLHPEDPWLSDAVLPTVLTDVDDVLPGWLRDPADYDRARAKVDLDTLARLQPERQLNVEVSAEAFFPAQTTSTGADRLGVSSPIPLSSGGDGASVEESEFSRVQFVVREARASRCEGVQCAESLIAEWSERGYAVLWVRERELPAGPAVEFVVADDESVINNVVIPSGGNVFVLVSGSTPEDFGAFLPHLELLHESFRALDYHLGPNAAETLRSAGLEAPKDDLRWRGRRALARLSSAPASEGADACVLSADPEFAPLWQPLQPSARAELLLDLYLTTKDARERRALLACTRPDAPEAARLTLLALLDSDATSYEFGRAAAKVHDQRLINDARRILYVDREPAVSDPGLTTAGNQPPFGLLQVIAALPDAQARDLTREMLGRRDPRMRALALLATGAIDYFGDGGLSPATAPRDSRTDPQALYDVVEKGKASDALVALDSLMGHPGAPALAAMRARADAMIAEGVDDEIERSLALSLGWVIARHLEKEDRKRLVALAAAISLTPEDGDTRRAERTREVIEGFVEDFDAGRKLLAKRKATTNSENPDLWARLRQARPAARSSEQVAGMSLAELIPGADWTFVRVGNAGLFATSLEGLLRRLAPANPADAYLVRAIVYDMVLEGGFSILAEEGGLDLSKPIECASPKGSQSFVCSASITDRERVLSILADREMGDDAGVSIPLSVATDMAALPLTLGALPIMLHAIVESPEDDFGGGESVEIAAERVRSSRTIAGFDLEYYATVEVESDNVVVDSEHYLFLDDRLLIFSGSDLAELLLRETPKGVDPLARAPAFAEATERWRDGVAMQAVDFADELGMDQIALELVLDNAGLEFRATGTSDGVGDYGTLDQLLPEGAVSSLSLALDAEGVAESFEDMELERCAAQAVDIPAPKPDADPDSDPDAKADAKPAKCGLAEGDKLPPSTLVAASKAASLGWYANPGDSLWQPWVLALPLDAKVRRAAKAAKIPLPSKARTITEHGGLFWLTRDGALVVATTKALAEAALARPDVVAPKLPPFARGHLDGRRAAEVMRGMIDTYEGESRGNYIRILATMVGLVDEVEFSGEWVEAKEGKLRAIVRLNLAESEEELELIDRWLASPEVSNASKLPRHLASADTQSRLQYGVRVQNAEQFAATSIPDDNPRMRVEILGDDELRLTVLPSSSVPAGTSDPLDEAERERMLDEDGLMRVTDPKIVALAKQLRVPGNDAATVAAVVRTVHEKVRYEITPKSLDAVTILERGQGDCTEYALLTVTLLRAAGIPAKLQEGMAAGGDEMVAHAWVAWHDGKRWREVDPTAGMTTVGSGHLELKVVDVLAMISLGRFEITEIKVMP
ncbi:Transglutaminase-like protein [Plesiocystis pacifica SIR-1]|uniref:Transglutaminase-like protein n=1 Tax=Plesiocystis pacifica SIR-1 TaxID=391625 RepID=A6GCN2_9BACT|nr:lasso peptide biosynthesis B2 protein [Plesiocystis pacifica]EDM76384.1 Transglutaminase-like protein [Plesiocystis pacifica SIR-1]